MDEKYSSNLVLDNVEELAIDINNICNALYPRQCTQENKVLMDSYESLAKTQSLLCEYIREKRYGFK